MQIRAGYEVSFDCVGLTPILLLLNVHPSRTGDLITSQAMNTAPYLYAPVYQDIFGNTVTRVVAPPGRTTFSAEFLIQDSGLPDVYAPDAIEHQIQDLPEEALTYLVGSRYCETDKLSDLAWSLFGNTPRGWARVQAICDYVHNRISFGYHHARNTRTAWEGNNEQIGVCRDFTHLAVALCRCMNIPARYCTGYLGDIRVPALPPPMDFSAWFEVYLGGRWYTFDARFNTPRIGRVLVARGRDAADVPISMTFGTASLTGFNVIAEEVMS